MNEMQRWVRRGLTCITLIGLLGYSAIVLAEEPPMQPVTVEIVQEENTVQPSRPFMVALRIQVPEEAHAYWKNPGDAGMPLRVEWELPEGWKAGPVQWPTPERFSLDSITGYGYSGEILLLTELTPPTAIPLGTVTALGANVQWLVCSDTNCLPGETHAEIAVAFSSTEPTPHPQQKATFAKVRDNLPEEGSDLRVVREKGKLSIYGRNLPLLAASNVYFCPETGNMIDSRADTVSVDRDLDRGETIVVLHDVPETQTAADELQGVLVMGDKSYSVDTAIVEKRDSGANTAGLSMEEANQSFSWILLLAFAGGMVLNLMPCVLPVLSFKVMSFIKMAGQSRSLTLKHGLFFSLGVLLSFWVLAGVMLTLQAYGSTVGWGFQLQDPLFVAVLAGVLFVFSLSLFGVFEIGTSVASVAGQSQATASQQTGFFGSFLSGVLATAIATPCTGPFLGTAVGFAFTVAAPKAMLVFTALGVGMAFPYLLLAAFPKLLRFMPKPGTWMVIFKEIMGFLLLATVLWLIWVFGIETNLQAVFLLMLGFLAFAMGSWVYGKFTTPMSKKISRYIAYVCALSFFVGGAMLTYASTTDKYASLSEGGAGRMELAHGWVTFSPEKVEELRREGRPVFIDFTAEWCLSCKANHVSLSSAAVEEVFAEAGVVKMKADWTKRDPVVTEALRKYGRNSIPLYVLYLPGSDEPQILPQVLTPEIVVQAMQRSPS